MEYDGEIVEEDELFLQDERKMDGYNLDGDKVT